jgi:hypothetical protein
MLGSSHQSLCPPELVDLQQSLFCQAVPELQLYMGFHRGDRFRLFLPEILPQDDSERFGNHFVLSSGRGDQNVTMLYSLEHRCWNICVAQGSGP